jgi:hypothetical protein
MTDESRDEIDEGRGESLSEVSFDLVGGADSRGEESEAAGSGTKRPLCAYSLVLPNMVTARKSTPHPENHGIAGSP